MACIVSGWKDDDGAVAKRDSGFRTGFAKLNPGSIHKPRCSF
jgi:hypothetical protein